MIKQTSALAALIALGSVSLNASPITSSITSGSCIVGKDNLNKSPELKASTDNPDGFVVFSAWDYARPGSCEPTIKNPTLGFTREEIVDGKFTVTIDKNELSKLACGIVVQFDFHNRQSDGTLAPLGSDGFFSLLYNSSLENEACYEKSGSGDYIHSDIHSVIESSRDNPKNPPNDETVNPLNPVPVPEPSTFVFVSLGLTYIIRRINGKAN